MRQVRGHRWFRRGSTAALVIPFGLLPFLFVIEADAQTVLTGRVLEDGSEQVVVGADVRLIDGVGRIRARAVSNESGVFAVEINVHQTQRFHFEASRIGYEAVTTPRFMIHPHESIHTEIRLLPDAVLLTPLTVVTRRPLRAAPGVESFRFRLTRGIGGHFITRHDIEEKKPFYLSDVLATIPGVRLGPPLGGGGRMVYFNRATPREGGCSPQIFVDGMLMNARTLQALPGQPGWVGYRTDAGARIDEYVSVGSVEGIEVYPGLSSLPPEFYNPDARCGVIAIWTRTT